MKYTGHRKIIHIGIDTLEPNDATRSPATLAGQHPRAVGLIDLLCQYTDLIDSIGEDQFLLDVTYNRLEVPFGARVAKLIKSDIKRELEVGVSIGMGPTKFLARAGGRLRKQVANQRTNTKTDESTVAIIWIWW